MNAAPRPSRAWLAALEISTKATRNPSRTLARAVDEWAERSGDAPALLSDRETLNYRELAELANRVARWALARGMKKGDAVALRARNRPAYFALWLGLTRVGVVVALLSPELGEAALAHALQVSRAVALISDDEAPSPLPVDALDAVLIAASRFDGAPLDVADVTLDDIALRIFTSGTTGFPKAAEVSHRRLVTWSHWFAGLAGLTGDDRLYDCLPMHHSVGGVVAVGAPLVNGGSVFIAEKFSASRFFDDLAKYGCTAFQYIGELCRYLVAAPKSAAEGSLKLRLAIGNGVAPDVWRAMLERLGPLQVVEFYASTEGNVWLYNVEGKIGALGRLPPYLAAREPLALVEFDADAQAPRRGADGRCIRAEVGEALGRIGGADQRFDGYSQREETEKKILSDVFEPGDAWMRTGDLMRRDAEGFYYFVDRIGDTFRWKGENVATSEVRAACLAQPGVADALVYGVSVPGHEGRAGMALIVTTGLDLTAFAEGLKTLPRYARPVFLRLTHEIAVTETHKPRRGQYAAEGFDPARVGEPLFVLDGDAYVPLDAERYAGVVSGGRRI